MSVPVAGLEPGVEAMARAMRAEPYLRGLTGRFGRFNDVWYDKVAENTLAALASADRLAIAGITEERLAKALEAIWPLMDRDGSLDLNDGARAILAAHSETPR